MLRPETQQTGEANRRKRTETQEEENRDRERRLKNQRGCYCIKETDGGDVLLLLEEEREGIDGARILCSMVASHVAHLDLYIDET